MDPPAAVVTSGSVHIAGLILVVFVGVTAPVPPIQQDRSADANIGLGHPHFTRVLLGGGFYTRSQKGVRDYP